MNLILTGVPGTGKSTLAKMLGEKLSWEVVAANGLIKKKKLWVKRENGVLVADLKKLSREVDALVKGKKDLILEGHLLCDIKAKADAAVVLRTNPKELRKRLKKRGYPEEKIDENVLSEALDYCTINAEENYGKVYEIDTTGSVKASLHGLMAIAKGSKERFLPGKINWAKELEDEVFGSSGRGAPLAGQKNSVKTQARSSNKRAFSRTKSL